MLPPLPWRAIQPIHHFTKYIKCGRVGRFQQPTKNIQKMNEFFFGVKTTSGNAATKTHWEDFSTLGPRFRELLRVGGGRAPGNAIQAGLGWCWVDGWCSFLEIAWLTSKGSKWKVDSLKNHPKNFEYEQLAHGEFFTPCVFCWVFRRAAAKKTLAQDFLQRPPAFSSLLRDLGLIESEVRTAADAVAEARILIPQITCRTIPGLLVSGS